MVKQVEKQILMKDLELAGNHYWECLGLPPSSHVLVILDKLSKTDPHVTVRRDMASEIIDKIGINSQGKIRAVPLEFDETYSREALYNETSEALNQLDELAKEEGVNRSTTVVYLGNDWPKKGGIYKAINDFGKSKEEKIRLAGSPGFTTGDCRVMSGLSKEKIQEITKAGDRFERFFKEQPKGLFDITTRDVDGKELHLNLPYNTAKAPFVAEIGNFDGVHEYAPNDELQNISYINIPGGEIYGTPYPFKKATGKFSAEGITFNVVDGLLINIEISKKVNKETLSTSQQELIARVNARNQGDPYYPYSPLPIAELGIGFYKQTDVKTYSDSSILSAEKTGPHIAFGHGFKSEEEEEIKNLSGKFYHADFVLDHPVIESTDENGANRQVFYHIIPNGI